MSALLALDDSLKHFLEDGFVLVNGVRDVVGFLSHFAEQFKAQSELPFSSRISLQNLARVPSKHCQDAVETDHLSLHFEMGLPLVPVEETSRVFQLLCLHIPLGERSSPVITRLLPIKGLASGESLDLVEQQIRDYCARSGAMMGDTKTGRLLCAAQIFDALHEINELGFMSEHRIAQWFNSTPDGSLRDGRVAEQEFFSRCGIDLSAHEQHVILEPGDLLIVDNLRVAHGRQGQRPAEELTQYLYGVADARAQEIDALRKYVVQELCKPL